MVKEREAGVTVEQVLAGDFQEKHLRGLPFEAGMKLLTELVGRVEAGALPLEQSLQAYERGAQLLEHLRSQLESAEERLKIISRKGRGAKDES